MSEDLTWIRSMQPMVKTELLTKHPHFTGIVDKIGQQIARDFPNFEVAISETKVPTDETRNLLTVEIALKGTSFHTQFSMSYPESEPLDDVYVLKEVGYYLKNLREKTVFKIKEDLADLKRLGYGDVPAATLYADTLDRM